jgi:hypothetical protein
VTRAAAVALVSGLIVTASAAAPPRGNWTRAEAKQFRRYQLYDVAPSVAHLPLTAVIRNHRPADPLEPPTDSVTFLYGDCEPDPTLENPSCALPLEIHIRPACGRERLKHPKHEVRGVPARLWSRSHLGVSAGRVFVGIYAHKTSLLWTVARSLRPVNHVDVRRGHLGDLPAPRTYPADSFACSGK